MPSLTVNPASKPSLMDVRAVSRALEEYGQERAKKDVAKKKNQKKRFLPRVRPLRFFLFFFLRPVRISRGRIVTGWQ